MANERNLVPNTERSQAERRENARKAGKASGKARQQKRTFRQVFAALLPQSVEVDDIESIAQLAQEGGQISAQEAIAMAIICKAMKGDTTAFSAIRDTVGEKPGQKLESKIDGGLTIKLAPEVDEYAQ
ncbi:Uncharacterised protein [Anaerotruncus sp. 2789STDY5834896]|uniref:Uncharacterized protein n=1 Tax=uncultured Anaerotruncus sp. TaxID=905011 RepID=A0A1C6FPV3_9FIRM|nr:Uncharacterised protein [uncultured Anaerotruncus sp.]